jgi:hypothetical protein
MEENRLVVSDAAKRIQDEMNMHAVAGAYGWAVFRLSDGRPFDHIAYPDRVDAVKATRWERDNCAFLPINPAGMSGVEAEAVLTFARGLSAAMPLPSAEFDFDPTMPHRPVDRRKKLAHLASGGKLFPNGI